MEPKKSPITDSKGISITEPKQLWHEAFPGKERDIRTSYVLDSIGDAEIVNLIAREIRRLRRELETARAGIRRLNKENEKLRQIKLL